MYLSIYIAIGLPRTLKEYLSIYLSGHKNCTHRYKLGRGRDSSSMHIFPWTCAVAKVLLFDLHCILPHSSLVSTHGPMWSSPYIHFSHDRNVHSWLFFSEYLEHWDSLSIPHLLYKNYLVLVPQSYLTFKDNNKISISL